MKAQHMFDSFQEKGEKLAKFIWSGISGAGSYLLREVKQVVVPLAETISLQAHDCFQAINPYLEEAKEFYEKYKEVIIIVGVAAVTYWLVRQPKTSQRQLRKKSVNKNIIVTSKVFMSDCSDEQAEDSRLNSHQPSRKREEERKEAAGKSSGLGDDREGEDSRQDKIFFEMYSYYRQCE